MKLIIRDVQVDSSTVMGSINQETGKAVRLTKPQAVVGFLRQLIRSMIVPVPDHVCSPACKAVDTLLVGAPFSDNVLSCAPE